MHVFSLYILVIWLPWRGQERLQASFPPKTTSSWKRTKNKLSFHFISLLLSWPWRFLLSYIAGLKPCSLLHQRSLPFKANHMQLAGRPVPVPAAKTRGACAAPSAKSDRVSREDPVVKQLNLLGTDGIVALYIVAMSAGGSAATGYTASLTSWMNINISWLMWF